MTGSGEDIPKKLAIAIPMFNEAATLEPLIRGLTELKARLPFTLLAILIDDCSTDNTMELIRLEDVPWITVISLEKRGGQHRALLAGFEHAIADPEITHIATMDADLDPPPIHVLDLLQYLPKHDMVIGRRLHRQRNPMRWFVSSLLRFFSFILRPNTMVDHGSMFRLFRRNVAAMCVSLSSHGAFVAGLSLLAARTPVEIPIQSGISASDRHTRYSPCRIFHSALQMTRLILFHPLGTRIPRDMDASMPISDQEEK